MKLRLFLAVVLMLLAAVFQFWFASFGLFVNFIFATLIVFAFFFDIWEMITFVLFGVLVINWQPAFSVELVLFAAVPLLIYASHRISAWQPWIAAPIAIVIGLAVFYAGAAPTLFFPHFVSFLADAFGSLIFGGIVVFSLTRLRDSRAL